MTHRAYQRFLASMTIDREKWHDGIGYDLAALDETTPDERRRIEALLLARQPPDWRDLEALSRIDSPDARRALEAALSHTDPAVRGAALRHGGPQLAPAARLAAIHRALDEATFYNGLTEALEAMETLDPETPDGRAIVDLMLHALLTREPEVAVHLAALLLYLHGRAAEPFDWEQRPFFLRFAEDEREQRLPAFADLCAMIGREAGEFLEDDAEPGTP